MPAPSLFRRLHFALVALFALWVAGWGLAAPERIGEALPFAMPAFHARVIGALYLAGAVLMIGAALAARRSATEVPLAVATIWTGSLLAVSLLHPELFHPDRPQTWLWFFAYLAFPATGLWLRLSEGRGLGRVGPALPRWIRGILVVQGAIAIGLAVALFVAPRAMAAVWPWPLPIAIAEIYAGPLAGLGVGAILARRLTLADLRLPGAFLFAVFAGLAVASTIHWPLIVPGPARWVWIATLATGFAAAWAMLSRAAAVAERPGPGTPVAWWLKAWLVVEVGFGLAAIGSIALFPDQTATNFAWPIASTVTAALLGAFYLAVASVFLGAVAARRWEDLRVLVVPTLLFTSMELAATLIHWDKFSVGSSAFAVWFLSYLLPPPVFAIAFLVHQRRARQTAPEGDARRLPAGLRMALLGLGTFFTLDAAVTFVRPDLLVDSAPWPLTPLTARAICGWLAAIGTMLVGAAIEDDLRRTRVLAPFLIALLPAIALQVSRFPAEVDFSHPRLWINVVVLSILFGIGLVLAFGRGRADRRPHASGASVPSISMPNPSSPI